MSTAEALSFETESVRYVYNKLGNVRAPMQADSTVELLLDSKMVQQPYATPDYLTTVGGQAGEARDAGFTLSFKSAQTLGIETLNELTGQWRPVTSMGTFVVVASL